ncbi:hypothetical protein PO124_13420 [Bacillus licheniformis]|nr:hypothetical protein [Bacillus licheniformis]
MNTVYQCPFEKQNKVVVGYWERPEVQQQIAEWMDVAVAYNESFNIKVARFGDNMRNVAVTEGDKIEAQIQFGWTVDYFGIGDLVQYVNAVTDEEINRLFAEYADLYEFDYGTYSREDWEKSVKYKQAMKSLLNVSLMMVVTMLSQLTLKIYME